MRYLTGLIVGCFISSSVFAQTLPEKPAEFSSTRLLSVKRLKTKLPDQGPDGLSFCFLVSRTATAQHKLAIKETKDFNVSKRSYRQATQASLGRVFEPQVSIHDAPKYVAEHPELASFITEAPEKSLVVIVAISGSSLEVGGEVEVVLHVGFGRTPNTPQAEDLLFRTKIPAA